MNLINDAWISVRRKNGEKIKIAPWQITEAIGTDKEIIELAAVRPDFNGAVIQFLIGLLQTTCAPKGNSDWRVWFNNPPSSTELKNKFESIVLEFNLDGTGPRFMQDLTIEKEDPKVETVERLLIDWPGEAALKKNTDFFVKRNHRVNLCLTCGVQALIAMQLNSPEGGRGFLTGLRGGGPVTTLIVGDTLWKMIWLNVLDINEFNSMACFTKNDKKDLFPWMGETRKGNTHITTTQDINPAQIYWSMPRRIRLIFKHSESICNLCGEKTEIFIETFYSKTYGVKYKNVAHPLTPTYVKDNDILSKHQREAVGYKFWSSYVYGDSDGQSNPAKIIKTARGRHIDDIRMCIFGYNMNSNKPKCWYEGVMPIIFIDNETQWKHYNAEIAMLICAADMARYFLSKAVAKALNAGVFNTVRQRFWQETEPEFYRQIAFLREEVIQEKDGLDIRRTWHKHLVAKGLEIFDDMSQSEMIGDVNAERVARAYNELRRNLNGKKLIIDILGLPKEGGIRVS